MNTFRIFIAEDDANVVQLFKDTITDVVGEGKLRLDFQAVESITPTTEAEMVQFAPHFAILDCELRSGNGFSLAPVLRRANAETFILLCTGHSDRRHGFTTDAPSVENYWIKYFENDPKVGVGDKDVVNLLRKIRDFTRRTTGIRAHTHYERLVDELMTKLSSVSLPMRELCCQLVPFIVNSAPITLLLLGLSGSGKTHLAKVIHEVRRAHHSTCNWSDAFVPFDLANPSGSIYTIFGYQHLNYKKTVTMGVAYDAHRRGTLFLDEIGQAPHELKAQLKTFTSIESDGDERFRRHPVTGGKSVRNSCDLILATNSSTFLKEDDAIANRFTLNTITLPLFASRHEDVPAIIDNLLSSKFGKPYTIERSAKAVWLGYVRDGRFANLHALQDFGAIVVALVDARSPESAHVTDIVLKEAANGRLAMHGTFEAARSGLIVANVFYMPRPEDERSAAGHIGTATLAVVKLHCEYWAANPTFKMNDNGGAPKNHLQAHTVAYCWFLTLPENSAAGEKVLNRLVFLKKAPFKTLLDNWRAMQFLPAASKD